VLGLVQASRLGKKSNTLILFGLALQAKGVKESVALLGATHSPCSLRDSHVMVIIILRFWLHESCS